MKSLLNLIEIRFYYINTIINKERERERKVLNTKLVLLLLFKFLNI